MTIISLIAAVEEENGLGKNNQLLCHLPADLKHFKTVTMGKPIIMGRKTFQSIGKPLPGRINIVLSRHDFQAPDILVVNSFDDALKATKNCPEVMCIGGGGLFQQVLPMAHRIYLTRIHAHLNADVYFPKLNKKDWICETETYQDQDEHNVYAMTYYLYIRR